MLKSSKHKIRILVQFFPDSPSHGGGGGGGMSAPGPHSGGGIMAPQGGAEGVVGVLSDPSLLWNKAQQLPEEAFRQVQSIYGEHFPLEARHHLAGK